ncbi:hypothetical protein WJX72_008743 [[Myrmecia] bisecta]|uniref:Uncharacterized protein n=1 Tax=[Myrmecia] bisecta TaxID=41462 RepID=A0AAW1P7D1_9CHLO
MEGVEELRNPLLSRGTGQGTDESDTDGSGSGGNQDGQAGRRRAQRPSYAKVASKGKQPESPRTAARRAQEKRDALLAEAIGIKDRLGQIQEQLGACPAKMCPPESGFPHRGQWSLAATAHFGMYGRCWRAGRDWRS